MYKHTQSGTHASNFQHSNIIYSAHGWAQEQHSRHVAHQVVPQHKRFCNTRHGSPPTNSCGKRFQFSSFWQFQQIKCVYKYTNTAIVWRNSFCVTFSEWAFSSEDLLICVRVNEAAQWKSRRRVSWVPFLALLAAAPIVHESNLSVIDAASCNWGLWSVLFVPAPSLKSAYLSICMKPAHHLHIQKLAS